LAQVGGFLRSGGCPLRQFLPKIRDRNNSRALAAITVSDYPESLLTVFELSFSSLENHSRQVLDILVYLDPDSIPYDLFQSGCVSKSPLEDDNMDLKFMAEWITFWNALKGLRVQSLIRDNPDLQTLSIHRFLQEEAFHHLRQDPLRRRRGFENALFLLGNKQPKFPNVTHHWSPELFEDSKLCLPHIFKLTDRFLESPETFTGLENRLGEVIFECAS
jgi:hypothetical protein